MGKPWYTLTLGELKKNLERVGNGSDPYMCYIGATKMPLLRSETDGDMEVDKYEFDGFQWNIYLKSVEIERCPADLKSPCKMVQDARDMAANTEKQLVSTDHQLEEARADLQDAQDVIDDLTTEKAELMEQVSKLSKAVQTLSQVIWNKMGDVIK